MLQRKLHLHNPPDENFFLWGPRQCGKSMLLKATYPEALWYDLLQTDVFLQLKQRPSLIREQILYDRHASKTVIIDEIQKIPELLDEVHWLIENTDCVFGLCGSSARKLRAGHANLLGGRAVRHQLFGLVSAELGADFNLERMLNQGYLPRHYLKTSYKGLVRSYVNDYLKEEVAAEGLVRNLPAFSDFLTAAALSDTELINFANIARECSVSGPTVKEYFQILVDTLLADFIPAYRKRPKRRVIESPKFYFEDVGVVNYLSRRGKLQTGSETFGKAFENWVFHELNAHRNYTGLHYELSYWRLAGGTEVDFIVNDMQLAIEAKSAAKITNDHLRGLRELALDHPEVKKSILVSLVDRPRKTQDGIEILPYRLFATELWQGNLIV
jgi:uncharacterized protein